MHPKVIFRRANRDEFLTAVEWAAKEGWNPGLNDADIFWETDSDGYVCIELDGEVIGTGSIVSYGAFGFMGFFIVRPDLRGQGLGARFWHWRKDQLLARMDVGATIGMDGVFDMQPFYAKGGFVFSHRNLRMEGVGRAATPSSRVVDLAEVPFDLVKAMDQRCFGYDRSAFLVSWVQAPKHCALGVLDGERLLGFGVIRPCRIGYKIGPLFADDAQVAEELFVALSRQAIDRPIFLDVPENNSDALRLAERYGLKEVFGCARMYYGEAPKLSWESIYGVTTFELG